MIRHRLGVQDLCLGAETDDPAEEDRRNRNLCGKDKVFLSVRNQHGLPAKPVHDHVDKASVEAHFHVNCFA